jgi:imidazolonepropionase-like amidohydrolase
MKQPTWLAVMAFTLWSTIAQGTSATPDAGIVLSHVTVIDATNAPAQPDMTVVIADGRIAAIGNGSALPVPHGALLVDATGKFLIPGLWDSHVHWADKPFLPLFIANGVTGVRIMWGEAIHYEWRRQSEAGRLLAPRLCIGSTPIDGPKPYIPGAVAVANVEQARQAVADERRNGAEFIKIFDFLPRDEYFAIVDEAKKQGLPVAGHVPLSISAEEASKAGQRSFEHLIGILPACSTRENDLKTAAEDDLAEIIAGKEGARSLPHSKSLRQTQLDTYLPEKATSLFRVLRQNGTWQCPTLNLLHAISHLDDSAVTNDPRLKYMPRWTREAWDPARARERYRTRLTEDVSLAKKEFERDLEVVGAMQKAGIGLLAGTDASNAYCMPGFSLHDELGFLVRAGLTPLQALQTATLNPARLLGNEKDFGTIEQGKIADLVLLDANPLDDIRNTKRIAAVIFRGALYSRVQLDKMLSDVRAEAERLPISDVLMATIEKQGVVAAVQEYRDLRSKQAAKYDFNAQELIGLGYRLLGSKQIPEAIEIFKLSVEVDPTDFNTWDSLAEAYMDHGDKGLAIQDYKKSLELNPNNTNALEKLKELGAAQP